jgi:hypothetical protein
MKAVYYIAFNEDWGHVADKVWKILEEEGYLSEKTITTPDGKDAYRYVDEEGNEGHENKKHKMNKENLWEEYSGNGNKKNYLKGILNKYNHPRYWHF